MTTVNVKLSQLTINNQNTLSAKSGKGTLADTIDIFFVASHTFNIAHPYYTSSSIIGNSARVGYSDGAFMNFSGLAIANPAASIGTATAANIEKYFPSAYRMAYSGSLDYSYAKVSGGTNFQNTGGTINDIMIQTLLSSSDPNYSSITGNATIGMHGAISLLSSGLFTGTISSLTGQSDRFISSQTITGNFSISGNPLSVGQNLTSSTVSGVLNSFDERYNDGSFVNVSDSQIAVTGNTIFDQHLLADSSNFSGNDSFNISLPAALSSPWAIAAGAGDDQMTIQGGGSWLSASGGSGNDIVRFVDDGHVADGGSGTDTAILHANRADYVVTKVGANVTVRASSFGGGTDTLSNFERLQFADSTVALDVTGVAGQAYRLYQAAFNRTPDAEGLGFWIHYMDGGMTLNEVAAQFMASKEFKTAYGNQPGNADFIDKLYHNVLHRAGETGGVQFWMDYLSTGGGTQAKVLAFFGESPENQAALIGTIGNGFAYSYYG